MLTVEENERVTRVGPGTPLGKLFRRYWWPACLSKELPERDGAPLRVRLLGEDLIAFRDSENKVGLIDAFCPHRRAPLFFGRNEECGLRCVYHGWKFDRHGDCVDMPSEPAGTTLQAKVKILAYPTVEKGGVVWAYMGPKELTPEEPDYEWTRAPATHRYVSKTFENCNYLQALKAASIPHILRSPITTSWVTVPICVSTIARPASRWSAPTTAIFMSRSAMWMRANMSASTIT